MPKRALHIEPPALEPVILVKRAKHCASVEALAPRLARAALAFSRSVAEAAGTALAGAASAAVAAAAAIRAGWRDAAARREATAAAAAESARGEAMEAEAAWREATEATWAQRGAVEAAAAGLFGDEGDDLSHHSLSSGDLDCRGGCYEEPCGADDCCFQAGDEAAAPFSQCLGRTLTGARCRVTSHHDFFNAEPLWAGADFCRLHAYQQPRGGGHGAGFSAGASCGECGEGEADCSCF